MCVCMYVCMYECMYVCMYVCMHACMYVCMHACMHGCMYSMTVWQYACMYIYICITLFIICVHIIYTSTVVYQPPSGPSCPDLTCVPGARAVPLAELLASRTRRTSGFWVSHRHLSDFHQISIRNFVLHPSWSCSWANPTNIITSILSWFCPLCQAKPKIWMIDHLQTTRLCHPDLNGLHRRGCMSLGRLCLSPQPAEACGSLQWILSRLIMLELPCCIANYCRFKRSALCAIALLALDAAGPHRSKSETKLAGDSLVETCLNGLEVVCSCLFKISAEINTGSF